MLHSYNKIYLDDAMNNLAEAFYVAVKEYNYSLDYFMDIFIVSGIATHFEIGNPKYVSGKSGTELVYDVVDLIGEPNNNPNNDSIYLVPGAEYWSGWVLAYYQWYSSKTFREIHNIISMEKIYNMYHPYHEMDEEKIIEYINSEASKNKTARRLQTYRKLLGMSQSELAKESGINLRTLQQYEIGAKDIKKASVSSVLALSNVLKCDVRDLFD